MMVMKMRADFVVKVEKPFVLFLNGHIAVVEHHGIVGLA